MSRNYREKPVVSLTALTISDQNCFALTGLVARQWREVVTENKIPHRRLGFRVLVLVDDWRRFAAASDTVDPSMPEPAVENEQLDSVDAVLASIGKKRAAGAR